MFFADWPIVMFSRLRTSRSSTIRPPWMMPMRRIFSFGPALGIGCRAAAWFAMYRFALSERGVRDAVENLRDEVLL
ncbi:MAG TPA: hypothetical protein VH951_11265, partial [Dehalococcoidia bacterium]